MSSSSGRNTPRKLILFNILCDISIFVINTVTVLTVLLDLVLIVIGVLYDFLVIVDLHVLME